MRRAFAIAAAAAMMLAAGEPAMAQSPPGQQLQMRPKLQVPKAPKIQPRIQNPNRPPNLTLIKPGQALMIAMRQFPNSKAVGVKLLPGGNYAVTLKRNNNALERVIVDGSTGAFR